MCGIYVSCTLNRERTDHKVAVQISQASNKPNTVREWLHASGVHSKRRAKAVLELYRDTLQHAPEAEEMDQEGVYISSCLGDQLTNSRRPDRCPRDRLPFQP